MCRDASWLLGEAARRSPSLPVLSGLFKPKTDEDEFLEWVRMKQDQIASIQSEIVQKAQEFYAHRK